MSIGEYLFRDCTGLTSITIPSSVKEIGDLAFSGCPNLASITVDEGNPVYDSREDCNAIIETASNKLVAGCKTLVIPSSVKEIGCSALGGCAGLASITIPASVESIGDYAMCACNNLESVTNLSARTYIGDDVFGDCPSLKDVNVPVGTIDYYRRFFDSTFDKYILSIIKEKAK